MTKKPTSAATKRLGCTFDAQTYELIHAIAMLRDCETAEAIGDAVWTYVGTLENRQREAILTVVRAKTGRLKRSCGPVAAEIEQEPAEGQGLVMNRISAIAVKSAAPVDAALENYGN